MTEPVDNNEIEPASDLVEIASGESPSAVDELEDVVDRMLPTDDTTSQSENPATYPHTEALADLELEIGESIEDAPSGEPRSAEGVSESTDTEASASEKKRSVTTEELDELMPEQGAPIEEEAVRVVDEIARITEAFEAMRDSAIREIQAGMADGQNRQEDLTTSLASILNEFRAVRQEMIETGRVAQDSIETAQRADHRVRDLGEPLSMSRQVRRETETAEKPVFDAPLLYVAGSVILLSWAVAFWIRTGDLTIALSGAVLANLVACGILLRKPA